MTRTSFRIGSAGLILALFVAACSEAGQSTDDQASTENDLRKRGHGSSSGGTTSSDGGTGGTPADGGSDATAPAPTTTTTTTTPPPPPGALGYPIPAMPAPASILTVGPGAMYPTPCAAVVKAQPNDEIDVAPGTYTDSCAIAVAGLRLRGVGGRPKIDLSGTDHPANYKGIYVIDAPGVLIDNLELTGAHISDDNGANAAGIRVEADDLHVSRCFIHDNQDGILGAPATAAGSIWIETTEFAGNGLGNGCNLGGCTHNLYLNHFDTVVFQFNWTHRIANDTPDKGHLFKSRAANNYLLYNRITDENSPASYEADFPNGGMAVLVGNLIEKGTSPGNGTLVAWGEEGATNVGKANGVYLAFNTLVNDSGGGTFVSVAGGGTLDAHGNIFAGPGATPAGLGSDELTGTDPLFVNRAAYDYHLLPGSPAIGKGIAPGTVAGFSLVPTAEYVHPTSGTARASANDLGAYE